MSLVTCITPTYNRAGLIKQAIESNLSQTHKEWEHIVVDDQSTDNTEEIVYPYQKADSRIKYFKNPVKGANNARNFGFEKSEGQYITFLDDDNINLPHKFESQLRAIKKTGIQYLVSGVEARMVGTNKLLGTYNCEIKGKGSGHPQRWMLGRELLKSSGGWDPEMPSMQEVELSYRLANLETFSMHNRIVSLMYLVPGSVSTDKTNAIKGKILMMQKQAQNMPALEASWWYVNIFWSLFYMGRVREAIPFLKLSNELENRNFDRFLTHLIRGSSRLPKPLVKKGIKLLYALKTKRMPQLVTHKILED